MGDLKVKVAVVKASKNPSSAALLTFTTQVPFDVDVTLVGEVGLSSAHPVAVLEGSIEYVTAPVPDPPVGVIVTLCVNGLPVFEEGDTVKDIAL